MKKLPLIAIVLLLTVSCASNKSADCERLQASLDSISRTSAYITAERDCLLTLMPHHEGMAIHESESNQDYINLKSQYDSALQIIARMNVVMELEAQVADQRAIEAIEQAKAAEKQ